MLKIYRYLQFFVLFAFLHLNLWSIFNAIGLKIAEESVAYGDGFATRVYCHFGIMETNSRIYENFGLALLAMYYFYFCRLPASPAEEDAQRAAQQRRYFDLGRRNAGTQLVYAFFRRKSCDYGWICLLPYIEAYVVFGFAQYTSFFNFIVDNYHEPVEGFYQKTSLLLTFYAFQTFFCLNMLYIVYRDFERFAVHRAHWHTWLNDYLVYMNVVLRRNGLLEMWRGREMPFRLVELGSGDPLPVQLNMPAMGRNHFGAGDGWWVQ